MDEAHLAAQSHRQSGVPGPRVVQAAMQHVVAAARLKILNSQWGLAQIVIVTTPGRTTQTDNPAERAAKMNTHLEAQAPWTWPYATTSDFADTVAAAEG